MSADTIVEQLVRSPRLGLYVDRLRAVLDEEHKRREQFYDTMSGQRKEEFINGEVIVHSPVKFKHELVSGLLCNLAKPYVAKHKLGHVGHEKLLVCLTRNDYEPDLCYFSKAKASEFSPDQMKFPAPDFIAEVLSPSTEALDRGLKFEDYAAHGVREYWIIDPDAELVEQYVLGGDAYELRLKMNAGVLKSVAIEGFEVPVRAIFDEQENLATLSQLLGVAS
jgi:Uma2 family endonuclease